MHPLHTALAAAANGTFPPVDGLVEVHPPGLDGMHGVVEFTGHAYVLTDHTLDDVQARGTDGFGGATHPDVLTWLAGEGGVIGSHDALLVARGQNTERAGQQLPARIDLEHHPRVERARHHRTNVRVHGDERGVVTLGTGVVGRTEISVELLDTTSGRGAGRALIAAGLELVDTDELVWAQVAPGNAASMRAFLSCGFTLIGAERLVEPSNVA